MGFLNNCCLCGRGFGDRRPKTGTWGVAFPLPHPLYRYCDGGMHLDCLEKWPHRLEFSRGYFAGRRADYSGMGTLLAEGNGWILGCGPSLPNGDPYYAEVDLSDWPCRLYTQWANWDHFVAGEFGSKLAGAALKAATRVMQEVALIAPDSQALKRLRLGALQAHNAQRGVAPDDRPQAGDRG